MLTHVHKMIHLIVSTFDQGWRILTVGGAASSSLDAALAVTGLRQACPISGAQCGVASVLRPDAEEEEGPDAQEVRVDEI